MTAKLTKVLPLTGKRLIVGFADGVSATVWLDRMAGPHDERFAALTDTALFRAARVDNDRVVWPNGASLAGELLYAQATRRPHTGS
ncbi:MAG: hypothetical protein ACN6N0_03995 [Microvirgula sp.]